MANSSPKSQSEAGNLIVRLGLDGLGNMMKGLNGVQAQFLLTKNAAMQAIKPLADWSKNVGNSVQQLDKLSMFTGLTVDQLQSLNFWTKRNGIDFNGFMQQIMKSQQAIVNMKLVNPSAYNKLRTLGIHPENFDTKKPVESIRAIVKEIDKIDDESLKMWALNFVEISPEMLWAFREGTKEVEDMYLLTDKQKEKSRELVDKWNEFDIAVESLKNKLGTTGPVAQGLQYLISLTQSWIRIVDDGGPWYSLAEYIKTCHPVMYKLVEWSDKLVKNLLKLPGGNILKQSFKEHPILSVSNPAGLASSMLMTSVNNARDEAWRANNLPNYQLPKPLESSTNNKVLSSLLNPLGGRLKDTSIVINQNIDVTKAQDIADAGISLGQNIINNIRNNFGRNT